ncbi:IS110 family transposase [Salmonirosea aquatica]|uniref:IS110 family transposase n=1 Tax=Salmonirosea aquatica TaxID=2654236 RepID=A0A7C9BD11_9BACT|nr:IS110 family transposase [Cytophagaceae bacterium SJW1-29]
MYKFVIGIDISKLTLDAALIVGGQPQSATHHHLGNTVEQIAQLFSELGKGPGFSLDECLVCVEATGLYAHPLLTFAAQHGVNLWLESAVRIKKSIGLQRGKNDKADALRIAVYAAKNQENARLWKPASATLTAVKNLASLRDRLIKSKNQLTVPVEEFSQMGDTRTAAMLGKAMKSTIRSLEADIAAIDKQIKAMIDADENLKELFALATSVVGIGTQTALALMIYTDGFTLFDDARKLACYAGVAPFVYASGTSVKGRTRVSKMANMDLKTALHMASLTAVKLDVQLKAYYQRKVADGKSKMSVLNAVKAKLLHRVLSVVRRKQKYENSANFSLVLS